MNFHEFKRGKRDFRTQDSMCQECGEHVSHLAHDPEERVRSWAPNLLAALKNIHHLTYESGWLDSLMKIREVAASAIEKAEAQS